MLFVDGILHRKGLAKGAAPYASLLNNYADVVGQCDRPLIHGLFFFGSALSLDFGARNAS
jgi:hypothetical protein